MASRRKNSPGKKPGSQEGQSKGRSSSERKGGLNEKRQTEYLLDTVSEGTLSAWRSISNRVNEYHLSVYYSLEGQRAAKHAEVIHALKQSRSAGISIKRWARIVSYSHSNNPLSAAGSLVDIGGRFNLGRSLLSEGRLMPFSALYIAENPETAIREKFGITKTAKGGLTPEEFALTNHQSTSTVMLEGELDNLFDLRQQRNLGPLINVLKNFKVPNEIHDRIREIHMDPVFAVKTQKLLHMMLMLENWRYMPSQFGIPANSQIFAQLVLWAGFDGIIYRSTKSTGCAIALFPENLRNSDSYLRLSDKSPESVRYRRLDSDTYKNLKD